VTVVRRVGFEELAIPSAKYAARMLTRLEVNGFKNLLRFAVDLGPYTCIAGPNGSGKSNVFDAINFLSLLADYPLMEAAQRVRSTDERGGDPRSLFWSNGSRRASSMSFAAEMIVPAMVTDDFGRTVGPTTTFLRYEVELGYEKPSGSTLGRLVLRREELRHIKSGEAVEKLRWPHSKGQFRDFVIQGRRAGVAFISTVDDDGMRIIRVHQDGGSRGQPRPSPAATAPRTIVSTTSTSADPTILAARREFQSWRMLALEPSAMRKPDRFDAPARIEPDGAHLPAALYRLAHRSESGERPTPKAVYAELATRVSALTDVRAVRVDRDERREVLTLEARIGDGGFLPARALSDGTLRFLALCILDIDSDVQGVLTMEEPENGIHPARMPAMVDLVRDLAIYPFERPGPDNPLRQVVVNTHAPAFVQLQQPDDLLFATVATTTRRGEPAETLRLLPLRDTWRASGKEPAIGKADIVAYLTAPPDAQLVLEDVLA
jgi:predicted ATPase